jgi:hypothetical protein
MNSIEIGKLHRFNYKVWSMPYGWNTIDEANRCYSTGTVYNIREDLCLVLECKSFNLKYYSELFAVKILIENGNVYWISANPGVLVLAAKE